MSMPFRFNDCVALWLVPLSAVGQHVGVWFKFVSSIQNRQPVTLGFELRQDGNRTGPPGQRGWAYLNDLTQQSIYGTCNEVGSELHILTPLPRRNQVVVQVKPTHLDLLLSNRINCAHRQLVVVPPQELQKHHTLFWGLFVTDGLHCYSSGTSMSSLPAMVFAAIVVVKDAQSFRFVDVAFDPATRCMHQDDRSRRQQYSRNIAVTGDLLAQPVLHNEKPDEFRFYVTRQETPQQDVPFCPIPVPFNPLPPPLVLQPRPSLPSLPPSLPLFPPPSSPLFLPPSPPLFLPPSPTLFPPPSPTLFPLPSPPLFPPSFPLPSSPPSPALSHQPESVGTVTHREELARIVAQLSQLEGLGPSVLTQLSNLEWDLTHSEMWSSCVELSELEKS
ncbi:hypothetical protein BD769DRAFT_1395570 [Suillus cothurnatus]|nr:hypothetical protein BD769DRAFT_1395570 [Suillus cothurnatus]